MKLYLLKSILISFFILIILIGCSSESFNNNSNDDKLNNNSIEGVIIFAEKKVLITDLNFNYEDKDLPLKKLITKYDNVLFLSFNNESLINQIQSGQKVEIWYSEILESNPPTYKVSRMEKIIN